MNKSQILMSAALAGILGASLTTTNAFADEGKPHCMNATDKPGTGACGQPGKNACAGKNGCQGKGFLEMTKAECDAKKTEWANSKDKKLNAAAKKMTWAEGKM